MIFRKILSSMLVAGLLLSNVGAYAASEVVSFTHVEGKGVSGTESESATESNLSQSDVENLVKEYIKSFYNIEIGETSEDARIHLDFREDYYEGKAIWNLSFNQHSNDKYLYIHASICDKTGELLNISKNEDNRNEPISVSQYTYEEATKIADDFIKQYKPELAEQLSNKPRQETYYNHYDYSRSYGLFPREYRVFFPREYEGVPFTNDGIHIGVNSGTGEIVSYSYQWTDEELPKRNGIITQVQANMIFSESLDFSLGYIPVYNGDYYGRSIDEVKIVYLPNYVEGNLIEADTGKKINQYQFTTMEEEPKTIDVTAEEKKQFENLKKQTAKPQKEMTKEEATNMAKKILGQLYEDVKIQFVNYSSTSGFEKGKVWNIQFNLGTGRTSTGHMSINAVTHEMTNLNYHNWMKREMMMMGELEATPVIKWEEAYKQTIKLLTELYPDKLKNVTTAQSYISSHYFMDGIKVENPEYNFFFRREENGIAFSHNNINVSLDSTTGLVQSIYMNWDDVILPKPQNLISKEEALGLYMSQTKTELAYGTIHQQPNQEDSKKELKLVYRNIPQSEFIFPHIDAKSGELLDYRGQEVKEEKQNAGSVTELLEGHWAERELTIMHDNGIIDLQNFDLSEVISKNEVIRMMINAMGRMGYYGEELELKFTDINETDPYFEDIEIAVRHGLVENEEVDFNGEESVTREDLAVMLVKMARLEKLAQLQDVYTLPVKDLEEVDPEYLGHVALTYGFNVLRGEEDNFKPKEKVTLAQTAVAIFRGFKFMLNRNSMYGGMGY